MPLHRITTARPRVARSTPDHRRISGGLDQHKALARAAWRTAREAQPLPMALIDRLWTDTGHGDRGAAGCLADVSQG